MDLNNPKQLIAFSGSIFSYCLIYGFLISPLVKVWIYTLFPDISSGMNGLLRVLISIIIYAVLIYFFYMFKKSRKKD